MATQKEKSDVAVTVEALMQPDERAKWTLHFHTQAFDDLRWSKEQSWKVLTWTLVALGAMNAYAGHLHVSIYQTLIAAFTLSAGYYLISLARGAHEARSWLAALEKWLREHAGLAIPPMAHIGKKRHNVVTVLQCVVVAVAAILAMRFPGGTPPP